MRRSCSAAISLATLVSFGSALTGCWHFAPPPTYPHEDTAYVQAEIIPAGMDSDPPPVLELLPGDVITIRAVSTETTSFDGLVIDSEGKVHVPGIGGVAVSKLPPHQAERTIEGMLQKQDRFVRVNVLVTAWTGHYATVIGSVASEGPKTITPGMRVSELLSAAGGPQRTQSSLAGQMAIADIDGARLMRGNHEVPVSVPLALKGDPRHNVLVHPGDQLFVPAGLGNRVAVLGVGTAGNSLQPYHPGMRLTEALAAGGMTIDADDEDIRIIRGPLKKPLIYQFDFDAFYNGKRGDIELAPGDVVFVTRHWAANMGEVIARVSPLIAVIFSGLTAVAFVRTVGNNNN